eukprot:364450-Chlamydomonas_euryale.AAC.2
MWRKAVCERGVREAVALCCVVAGSGAGGKLAVALCVYATGREAGRKVAVVPCVYITDRGLCSARRAAWSARSAAARTCPMRRRDRVT